MSSSLAGRENGEKGIHKRNSSSDEDVGEGGDTAEDARGGDADEDANEDAGDETPERSRFASRDC